MKKKWKLILVLLIGFIALAYFAFNTRLKEVTYVVKTPKVNTPITLALVTDLHACYYGEGQTTLLNAINKMSPDAILLGGDIFDDVLPDSNTQVFLNGIAKLYPIYYVTGNHEFWRSETESIFKFMKDANITLLRGESATLEVKGEKIQIHGIDDPDASNKVTDLSFIQGQLEKVKDNIDTHYYNILLAHRPFYIETYLNYDFDLITCGHAHGGQWRIPYLLNGLLAPDEGFFPKYAGGQFFFDQKTLIVSRGLSRESTRIPRIFNRPELVEINIIP